MWSLKADAQAVTQVCAMSGSSAEPGIYSQQ